jgi:putative inorganic carbon (hco3(-)) transporter
MVTLRAERPPTAGAPGSHGTPDSPGSPGSPGSQGMPAQGTAGGLAPRPAPPPRISRVAFWLYAGHLFTLGGIALSNILAGFAVLATPWAARAERRQAAGETAAATPAVDPDRRRELAALDLAVGFYVLVLLVAMAASYRPEVSLRAASEIFTLGTLVLAPRLVRGERDLRRVVDGLVVVGGLVALWGLAQYLGDYGGLDRRIRGPFSHWMTFSGFLLLCDLLVAAQLLYRRRDRPWPANAWRLAALVAINLALFGSLTRSAWVGLVGALAVAAALRSPRRLLWAVPAALVFILLAPVPVLQRAWSIFDLSDRSNYDRLCMVEAGLRMVAERPLTGLGPEMIEERYPIYRSPTAPRYETPHLHNAFLQLAAERGLPGLAAYLLLVALAAGAAWRGYRREGGRAGPRSDLWLGCLLALVAFNLAALFEHNWGDTEVQRLALFVMAIPFCLGAARRQRRGAAGSEMRSMVRPTSRSSG